MKSYKENIMVEINLIRKNIKDMINRMYMFKEDF